MLYCSRRWLASSNCFEIKSTKTEAGHDAGTMNCPVGDNINGPASLKEKKNAS